MNNNEPPDSEKINNIILETKIASIKPECENTTPKWTKPCPKCGKELVYTSMGVLNNSIRRNCVCAACAPHRKKLPIPDGGWRRKCPTCGKGLHYKKKWAFQQAEKYNTNCSSCGNLSNPILDKYIRNCPKCNTEIKYKLKDIYYAALALNSGCNR